MKKIIEKIILLSVLFVPNLEIAAQDDSGEKNQNEILYKKAKKQSTPSVPTVPVIGQSTAPNNAGNSAPLQPATDTKKAKKITK